MRTTKFTQLKRLKTARRKKLRGIINLSFFLLFAVVAKTQVAVSFNYTGAEQTWTVPANIDEIVVEAYGAQGGDGNISAGGLGGYTAADLDVTPGELLYIYVGGQGASMQGPGVGGGGFNGGGDARGPIDPRGAGGGATDIRQGGNTLNHRMIVGGGGGGSCSGGYRGGDGGGLVGDYGIGWDNAGGTQTNGGQSNPSGDCGDGGFGFGGSTAPNYTCAGGGGGWYGGASGCSGGGGSSYFGNLVAPHAVTIPGQRPGNGLLRIAYYPLDPPANDNCINAEPIECGAIVFGDTENAGIDNPPACITPNGTSKGVWYLFQGTGDPVEFSTCNPGTNFETKISAYVGTCDELICVDGVEGTPGCFETSKLTLQTIDGAFYYILIHGIDEEFGDFELTVSCPNISCSNAEEINCGMTYQGVLAGPGYTPNGGGMNAWYELIGGNECVEISTCHPQTNANTTLKVFTGDCLSLNLLTENDDDPNCGNPGIEASTVEFFAEQGISYFVSVSTRYVGMSNFAMTVVCTPREPLVIDCPPHLNLSCNETVPDPALTIEEFQNQGGIISINTCQGPPTLNISSEDVVEGNICEGIRITRTYRISSTDTDEVAVCRQYISISPTPAPEFECADDFEVSCFEEITPYLNPPVVNTVCPLAYSIIYSEPRLISGAENCGGAVYALDYFLRDACGRMDTCTVNITIADEGPSITCLPDMVVECSEEIIVDISDATVTTSCDLGYTIEITGPKILNGAANCPGTTYLYYYVAMDECGRQSQCARAFTIMNEAPSIACTGGESVECVEDIPLDPTQTSVVTSCGGTPTVQVAGPFLKSGIANCHGAVYEVHYYVRDNCNRTAVCISEYIIENSRPQIIESAPDRIVECAYDIHPETELIIASSSCGLELEITSTLPQLMSGDEYCDGEYEIIYTATDLCGRTATAAQYFTIQNEAPRVIPPAPTTIACLEELDQLDVNNAEYTSACNMPIVKTEIIGPIYNEEVPLCDGSIINILYSATDACGRMTCEPQIIFIELNENTLANQFPNVTVDCDEISGVESATEHCGFAKLKYTDLEKQLTGGNYQILRTYQAEDPCANAFEYTQTITVHCDATISSREYCTLDATGWKDSDMVATNPKFEGVKLSHFDPLIIGARGHRLLFTDMNCLPFLLSDQGDAHPLQHENPEVYVGGENDCGREELKLDENGYLGNALLNNMIALELNIRADGEFGQLNLKGICLEWDSEILEALNESPTIKDLAALGNKALAETYDIDYSSLSVQIEKLLQYFQNCNTAACAEPILPEFAANGSMDINIPDLSLRLFPNPSTDFINISFDGKHGDYSLQIYDAVGQLMHKSDVGEKIALKVDARKWKTGIYQVGLVLDGVLIKTEKIVIAKY